MGYRKCEVKLLDHKVLANILCLQMDKSYNVCPLIFCSDGQKSNPEVLDLIEI